MKVRKSQSLFLALLIGTGIIAGCSTPGNITDNLNKNTSISNNNSNSNNSITSTVAVSELQSAKVDLASLHDDEAAFSDSEALISDSFLIKSEESEGSDKLPPNPADMKDREKIMCQDRRPMPPMMDQGMGDVRENLNAKRPPADMKDRERIMCQDGRPMPPIMNREPLRKMRRDDFRRFEKENAKQLRDEFKNTKPRPMPKPMPGQLEALDQAASLSSAIKINDDGTITVDPLKLQSEIRKVLEARKKELEKRLSTINNSLKNFKEVSKEKVNKLKRKNNVVRNTDKVVTENADGTTSETMTVKFENTKQGITRENTIVRTLKDGKVIAIDHSLKVTTKSYTRTASRVVTFNEDGSKLVKTNSVTEWKNGRKVERNEERLVSANGNASGSGTITVTNKDGQVKTYNLSVSKTLTGELSSTIKDESTKQEVQVVQDNETAVEVVNSENGKTEQQEVDLEQVVTEV
jgi:hypothetical protein